MSDPIAEAHPGRLIVDGLPQDRAGAYPVPVLTCLGDYSVSMAELARGVDIEHAACPVAAPSGEYARLVFEQILRHGPRPRSELAAWLQLSGATLTRVTRSMLGSGLLRELPTVIRERGRPQVPLDVDEHHARVIGVKVVTSQVYAVATTLRGNPLEEISAPLDCTHPEAVERAVAALVEPLLSVHAPVAGVGISLGGRVTDDGAVVSSAMLGWETPVPLEKRLTGRLGIPVTVQNDLIALLQGVLWFGIGRRYESFALVTIGAGVATGVVHQGQVIKGRSHLAGLTEALPTAGPDGRHMRLAEIAGGPALVDRARASGAIGPHGDLEDLLAAHRAGDPAATRIGWDTAQALAVSVGTLVGVLDPEAVIVGGEAIGLTEGHRVSFEALVRQQVPPVQRDTAVRRLPEDFDEWTRGAAVTAIQRFAAGG